MMSSLQILYHDHNKNHAESESFLDSVEEILDRVLLGYSLVRFNNTLIIYQFDGALGEGVEFHCYNAEPGLALAQNVLSFFQSMREQGIKWAATPYQNPRVTELLRLVIPEDNLEVAETPIGFLATVRL
jgi:hypothetical protein